MENLEEVIRQVMTQNQFIENMTLYKMVWRSVKDYDNR